MPGVSIVHLVKAEINDKFDETFCGKAEALDSPAVLYYDQIKDSEVMANCSGCIKNAIEATEYNLKTSSKAAEDLRSALEEDLKSMRDFAEVLITREDNDVVEHRSVMVKLKKGLEALS